jgi:hypothetical protein
MGNEAKEVILLALLLSIKNKENNFINKLFI